MFISAHSLQKINSTFPGKCHEFSWVQLFMLNYAFVVSGALNVTVCGGYKLLVNLTKNG